MNNSLIKQYIDDQPAKIVTKLDFATGKLPMTRLFNVRKEQMLNPKSFAVHIC